MSNDVVEPEVATRPSEPVEPVPAPGPLTPLVMLAPTDEDTVCTDELCLPAKVQRP